jgi:hypothetical protein
MRIGRKEPPREFDRAHPTCLIEPINELGSDLPEDETSPLPRGPADECLIPPYPTGGDVEDRLERHREIERERGAVTTPVTAGSRCIRRDRKGVRLHKAHAQSHTLPKAFLGRVAPNT